MGLLDNLYSSLEDPLKAAQITALAQGLLGPGRSMQRANQGLLGMQAAAARAKAEQVAEQERQMKKQLIESQIAENISQEKAREAAIEKQKNIQAAVMSMLNQSPADNQYGTAGGGISMGGVRETMTPKPGGIANARLEDVLSLKAMGGPDLLEGWKIGVGGLEQKPGMFYLKNNQLVHTPDPKEGTTYINGRLGVMPGAPETKATLAGATKEAEARAAAMWQPFHELGPKGEQRMVGSIGGELSKLNQQYQPQSGPRYGGAPTTLEGQQAALKDVASAEKDINAWSDSLRVKKGSADGPPQLPPAQQPRGIKTGLSPREKTVEDTLQLTNSQFMKDQFPSVLASGASADDKLNAIQTSRLSMKGMGWTGWGAEAVGNAANVLATLGVPQAERFATNMQQFQQAAMTRSWALLVEQKGVQTEGDAKRAEQTYAKLSNTPKANEFILDLTEAISRRDKLRADFYKRALPLAQQEGDLQRVEREWNQIAPSVWRLPVMQKWGK